MQCSVSAWIFSVPASPVIVSYSRYPGYKVLPQLLIRQRVPCMAPLCSSFSERSQCNYSLTVSWGYLLQLNDIWALAHSFLDQSGIFLWILLQCFFPSKWKVFVLCISAYACYQSQEASFFTQLQHTLNLFLRLQSSAAYCCFVSFLFSITNCLLSAHWSLSLLKDRQNTISATSGMNSSCI